LNADERIRQLELLRHPEGGWYRETYRASARVQLGGQDRAASTSIYFLLASGEVSNFHRIDADEQWHHYEGAALRLHILDDSGLRQLDVGPLDTPGARPQCWVPAGAWFGAEVLSDDGYALVGCTVAPGFEFASFELANRPELLARWPAHRDVIERLTIR